MATTLFNPEYTLVYQLEGDLANKTKGKVVVKIASNSYFFNLYNSVAGEQPFRTQIDITLDGKMKLLSAGKAAGSIKLNMLEPDVRCPSGSAPLAVTNAASRLVDRSSAVSRSITVTLPSTRFKGVITSVSPTIVDIDGKGTFVQSTAIEAVGTWEVHNGN